MWRQCAPHLIDDYCGSLGPRESAPLSASRSVYPFTGRASVPILQHTRKMRTGSCKK